MWCTLYTVGPTPWYENYRDDFIQLMKQSDHEYIRHYMGCILVSILKLLYFYMEITALSL